MVAFLGTLKDLYSDFQELDTEDRLMFLRKHKKMNLVWDINWENLITAWEKNDPNTAILVAGTYSETGDEGENFDSAE